MWFSTVTAVRWICTAYVLLATLTGCATLPEVGPQPVVSALPPATSGSLSTFYRDAKTRLAAGDSGFVRLSNNAEAYRWRLELVERATRSIDAQYFIWDNDAASNLLFLRLLDAADRGVRIRLLVDDMSLVGHDRDLAALSKHPNLRVKVFNPVRERRSMLAALGEFLLDSRQLNRRMHNKLLVADNRVGIVGGRNIGSAYYGFSEQYNFRDLDVLVTGPVIHEISQAFDRYWNAELSYPAEAMSARATAAEIHTLRQAAEGIVQSDFDTLAPFSQLDTSTALDTGELLARMHPGSARFLQDEPVLIGERRTRLLDMLEYVSDAANDELIVISPYFIPEPSMLQSLEQAANRGVSVKLLTATLASGNHTIAHSHYKKYRRRILETGTSLYEYRHQPSAEEREQSDTQPVRAGFIALHTKAIIVDRNACYVGSLNLDPRAVNINTENGLYIISPGFCGELSDQADRMMAPPNAWHVDSDESDRLRWTSSAGTRHSVPARNFWQRIGDFFYRWLPVESQI